MFEDQRILFGYYYTWNLERKGSYYAFGASCADDYLADALDRVLNRRILSPPEYNHAFQQLPDSVEAG